ncbi:hypothetical protein SPHS6_00801 [Sphingobium sp. S6]|nr:hypothetical protein SPHS6_00801 [Sphingobium sp. S6]CAD7336083.1 hypothetical protein SPHS8_00841 [Sphingobium sp. S8]
MAVGSAIYVGMRQIKIARTQAETAQMTLREKLFDRRFELYADMDKAFSAELKGEANAFAVTPERSRIVLSSKFLFPFSVRTTLGPALDQVRALRAARNETIPGETDQARQERITAARDILSERYETFASRMGEYMKLYDAAADEEADSSPAQSKNIWRRLWSKVARL